MAASRAYLPGGRMGLGLSALATERARIADVFSDAGAERVEPAALQPAELLLNLYGEDIRGRAYITEDPVDGALVLRPEFTVPVALLHRAGGNGAARYAYSGPVWRRQAPGSARPTEYLQAGIESFGDSDPTAADADMFVLIRRALGDAVPLRAMTGDLSIALAAIRGLGAPDRWVAALHRHIWRPARFRAVLEGYGPDRPTPTKSRAALLAAAAQGPDALDAFIAAAAPEAGLRARTEIAGRATALAEDASSAPLPREQIAFVEAALDVKGPSAAALASLRALAADAPAAAAAAMGPVLDRMEARLAALSARGVDAEALPFDASFGRALEYYDGFTFEFCAPGAPHLPPLGGGGRYDALTARLGLAGPDGGAVPGIGGVVRPEAMLAAAAHGAAS
ncbi:MAG: ATP phosphoribosyltransferase regulatory subunit [Paracoccaceae bacterium]|jgi:ATP phosphoribosyltransferase regulatory subunit